MVEGEFKYFKGSLVGLDIIGLPSIHGFYNGDVKGKLHEDIQELIITCQVKKVVLLVDADLLTVTWKEDKDLSLRPSSFYAAVKSFPGKHPITVGRFQSEARVSVFHAHQYEISY